MPSNDSSLDFDKILSKGSNVFPSIRRPDDTLQRVFFDILMFLFEQRDSGDEWGTKNEILCPLSFLTTLQRAPVIYGFAGTGLQKFQKIDGFSERITSEFIDNLITDNLTTMRVTDSWSLDLSQTELDAARRRCLGINDKAIQLVKNFISTMKFLIRDDHVRSFGMAENFEQVQQIEKFTQEEKEQINKLEFDKLKAHFYGNKVEEISNLSLNLLGEDNPKLLYFLQLLFSEVEGIDNPEKLNTAIAGSLYILKNIYLLKSLNNKQWSELFGLSDDEAYGLSEDLGNLSVTCNTIRSSSASVYSTPVITLSRDSCATKYINIGLHLKQISLTSGDVSFNQRTLKGFKGDVTGFFRKNEHETTVALPALGDLVLIIQIKHGPKSPDPLLSFEGASPKTFFISFPEIQRLENTTSAPLPFKETQEIIIKTSVRLDFDIKAAPSQQIMPSEEEIIVNKEFSWAVARVIHDSDQAPPSYAILVTGVFKS